MIVLGILPALALLGLAIAYGAYRYAYYSPNATQNDPYMDPNGKPYTPESGPMFGLIREMEELPFESVWIRSRDGLRLHGRYYHVRDGAPLQIQCHGYRGHPLRDFCGGNKLAREAGLNTLVIEERAHCESEGHTISFGINERWDCLAWAHQPGGHLHGRGHRAHGLRSGPAGGGQGHHRRLRLFLPPGHHQRGLLEPAQVFPGALPLHQHQRPALRAL